MSKEQLLGILRHVLTFVGGLLVTKGLVDAGMVEQVLGGLLTIVGGLWSVFSKKTSVPTEPPVE